MLAHKSARLAPRLSRSMASGGRAAFNWRDPLLLDEQLTDEEAMIQVRRQPVSSYTG